MSGLAWAYESAKRLGEYNAGYGHSTGTPEVNYVAVLIMIWVVFLVVLFYLVNTYWDEIEAIYNAVFNRNAIRSVTVVIKGTEVDPDKIRSLTKDVNGLLNGKVLSIVQEKHRINAKHIVGMSVTPGKGCLMFTTWYRG